MAASPLSLKLLIEENDTESAKAALSILVKLTRNVINNPDNEKYRRLRLSNAIVENKLLPTVGAMECLFEIGFVEDGEFLHLPSNVNLGELKGYSAALDQALKNLDHPAPPTAAAPAVASQPRVPSSTGATQPSTAPRSTPQQVPPTPQLFRSQFAFLRRLQSSSSHVQMYEDPRLQAQALACMPQERLRHQAQAALDGVQAQDNPPDLQDMLLLELLAWFKKDFFTWMNSPTCTCGGSTSATGMATPTAEEQRWGAGRVEAYRCSACQQTVRFTRYNHPGKLLETRTGRCGEWANCFTLCCRAMGMEARYVLDWTDHVWTEVYSHSQKRWLHCDSCENACDKPLVYENGWGKKLSYVIAFSKDDIQDVTWRYSNHHAALLQRRKECNEKWLVETILNLRAECAARVSEQRRQELLARQVAELVELMLEKKAGQGEQGGRVSGAASWRSARGELGQSGAQPTVISPEASELAAGRIHVRYCCASDQYVRDTNDGQVLSGWAALTHSVESIQRKEELDWNMVYLARQEGADTASIAWKIDLSGTGHVVGDIRIAVASSVFENGAITWLLCSDSQCARLKGDGSMQQLSEFCGEKTLTLKAQLSGGHGDCAWQHTQLFRQASQDTNSYPLVISVILKKET